MDNMIAIDIAEGIQQPENEEQYFKAWQWV